MEEETITALIEAFDGYKVDRAAEKKLCYQLDEFSKSLAIDPRLRQILPVLAPSLWAYVSELWDVAESGFDATVSPGLISSLARFTRNLVAEVPRNQEAAFINEPKIRRLLHRFTSFSYLQDINLHPLIKMLVQTLSNLVTLNAALAAHLWDLYTMLPEDQNIIIRLLASSDSPTTVSVLVLILNCVKTDDAGLRKLTRPVGLRIVVMLLDRTESWVDQEAEGEAFTLAYRIFEALLDQDFGAALYHSLSIEDEPVTPHQTTLLKFMDSYVRHQEKPGTSEGHEHGLSFLAKAFFDLGIYCRRAIQRFLGLESVAHNSLPGAVASDDPKELDLRLPKVSAALILLSHCLTTICLEEPAHVGYERVVMALQAEGFVEDLVETLRLVDRFLPRIVFGQAATDLSQPSSSTRRPTDTTGFNYLKRDLVRLLGTICHERKEIQDRIRECGGIPVVMNLCVVDERNPYLQEHALFALRNILHRNAENQRTVDAMKGGQDE